MEFKTFLMAFDARVQSRVINSADRLYYLDQHLVGEPKELVSGCLHIEPDEGYKEARLSVVTQKGTNKPVKTYAFYDNGSAGCFITNRLRTRLEATSTHTKIQYINCKYGGVCTKARLFGDNHC